MGLTTDAQIFATVTTPRIKRTRKAVCEIRLGLRESDTTAMGDGRPASGAAANFITSGYSNPTGLRQLRMIKKLKKFLANLRGPTSKPVWALQQNPQEHRPPGAPKQVVRVQFGPQNKFYIDINERTKTD